ncbi:RluA family pseudouridine synthase [Lacticaseibacillus baoqingensis]|uniref:Pseudouridine synthase n=1 Tax=Lacticaseibacillus baoqingensis TaxID=2486013 RepID=A0ABW4E571_9LACO|nr:RluA family pseudouridine synthase [Lacticaseibacillus baoqingensis]
MPEFTLHTEITQAYPQVTALLQAWHVPKRYRFWLRKHQAILINGQYRYANLPVAAGEQVTIHLTTPPVTTYQKDDAPLTIVYEDAQVLVVNKPAGIKTHPNQPGERHTLMNAVANYLAPNPAYITHRLDMATSGLTLIAKNPLTQALIDQQLATKAMQRSYVALVPHGLAASGTIDAPIGHDPTDKRKRQVRADGEFAITHYRVIQRSQAFDRVWLTLATGRTHQLRVHLAHLGFAIIGDPLYAPVTNAKRLMLHAAELTWQEPLGDRWHTVKSPAPF